MTQNRSRTVPFFLMLLTAFSLLSGLGLRFTRIDAHVFWHDEVHTVLRAFGNTTREFTEAVFDGKVHTIDELRQYQKPDPQKDMGDTLRSLASHPEHGPLYYFLVRLFAPFSDPPISGARYLAAFISLLLFPAIFLLAKELFPSNKSAPLIAVCIAALSPIHILYAREARQYSLYEVILVFSTYQFLKTCRTGNGWILYGVTLILGLYSHLMFGVLILTHACFLLLDAESRRHWKNFIKSVVVTLVFFSPWLWVVLNNISDVKNYTGWMKYASPVPVLLAGWAEHLHHILFDLPGLTALQWFSVPLVIFCFYYAMRNSGRKAAFLLSMIIGFNVLPLMIPDLVSGGQRSMGARYVLPATIALQLCVVFFLSRMMEKQGSFKWLAGSVLMVLLFGTGLFGYRYLNTDTWWNRYCSMNNPLAARLINSGENPLVAADPTPTNPGEILSISYLVKPETLFLTIPWGGTAQPADGHSIFLLNPSWELQVQLKDKYGLSPVAEVKDALWMRRKSK